MSATTTTPRECPWCEMTFEAAAEGRRKHQRFCGDACRHAYRSDARRRAYAPPEDRQRYCFVCGVTFTQPAKGRPAIACSRDCARKRAAWAKKQDLPISSPLSRDRIANGRSTP